MKRIWWLCVLSLVIARMGWATEYVFTTAAANGGWDGQCTFASTSYGSNTPAQTCTQNGTDNILMDRNFLFATYQVAVMLFEFDTAALIPANQVVTAAQLELYVPAIANAPRSDDNFSIICDWYDNGGSCDFNDCVWQMPANDAFAGIPIRSLTSNQVNILSPLLDADAHIPKVGSGLKTRFRCGVSGAQPTFLNQAVVASGENLSVSIPVLRVQAAVPTVTPTITITPTVTNTVPIVTPTPLPTCFANETPPCAPRCLEPGP